MARSAEGLKGVTQYTQDGITRLSLSRSLARDPVVKSLHRGVAAALPQYTGAAVLIHDLLTQDPVDLALADGGGSKTPRWLDAGFLHETGAQRPPVIELPASKGRRARRGMQAVRTIEADELAQILVRDPQWPGEHNPPFHVAILTEGIDTGSTVRRIAEATLIATADSPVTPRIDVVTAHMEGVVPQDATPADLALSDDNLRRRTQELEGGLPLGGGHVHSPHIPQWESPGEHPALYAARGTDTPLAGPTVGSILSASLAEAGIDEDAIPRLVPLGERMLRMAGQVAGRTYLLEGEEAGLIVAREAVDEVFSGDSGRFRLHFSRPGFLERKRKEEVREETGEQELSRIIQVISTRAMTELLHNPGAVEDIVERYSGEFTNYLTTVGSWVKNRDAEILKFKKGIISTTLQFRLAVHMLANVFQDPQGLENIIKMKGRESLLLGTYLNVPGDGTEITDYANWEYKIDFLKTVKHYASLAHHNGIQRDSEWMHVDMINEQLDKMLALRGLPSSFDEDATKILQTATWELIRNMGRILPAFDSRLSAHAESVQDGRHPSPVRTLSWDTLQNTSFADPVNILASLPGLGDQIYATIPYPQDISPSEGSQGAGSSFTEQFNSIRLGFENLGYQLPEELSPATMMVYLGALFMPAYATAYFTDGRIDADTGIAHRIEQVDRERKHTLAVETRAIAGRGMEKLLNAPGNVWGIVDEAGSELDEYIKTEAPWTDDPEGRILRLKKGIISSTLQYLVAISTLSSLLENPQATVKALNTDFPKNSGDYVAYQLNGNAGFTWFPFYEDGRHNFMAAVVHSANTAYENVVASSPEWSNVEDVKVELNAALAQRGLRSTYSDEPEQNCSPTVWSMMRNMNSILWSLQPVLRELSGEGAPDNLTWSAIQSPYFDRPGDLVGLANVTIPTIAEVTPPNHPTEVTIYRDDATDDINRYAWSGRTAQLLEDDLGGMCFGFKGLHETIATRPFFESIKNSFEKLGFHLPPRISAVQLMNYIGAVLMPLLAEDYPELTVEADSGIAHQLVRVNAV